MPFFGGTIMYSNFFFTWFMTFLYAPEILNKMKIAHQNWETCGKNDSFEAKEPACWNPTIMAIPMSILWLSL